MKQVMIVKEIVLSLSGFAYKIFKGTGPGKNHKKIGDFILAS